MKKENRLVVFLRNNRAVILILLFLFLLISVSYFSKGFVHSILNHDEDTLANFLEHLGVFSYPAFILLVILEVVLAPIPAFALYVAGGALFGTILGSILALIGNLIGAFIAFIIARRFGRRFVEKRIDSNSRRKFDHFAETYGGYALFLLRINPFTSSDIFSYISGLSKIKTWKFLLGTGLGLAPMIIVQAYFGESFVKTHPLFYVILTGMSLAYLLIFLYLILKTIFIK